MTYTPRRTHIDLTGERLSQRITICPICGRKGIRREEDNDGIIYLHKGRREDAGKVWYDSCKVDGETGDNESL